MNFPAGKGRWLLLGGVLLGWTAVTGLSGAAGPQTESVSEEIYHQARDKGVKRVIDDYVADLEALLKKQMAAANLEGTIAVRDEIASIQAWLEKEMGSAMTNPPVPLEPGKAFPPLAEAQRAMHARLTRGLIILNQQYFDRFEAAQKALTQEGDLEEALAIRTFRKKISAELTRLTGEPDQLPNVALPAEPIDLLSDEERNRWKIQQGKWTFRSRTLIGEGDSTITYTRTLKAPFELSFTLEVKQGQRPRIKIGKFTIAHDGYNFAMMLHPKSENRETHPYERDRKLKIRFVADADFVELHVNGKLLERREKGISQPLESIDFRGGDGWSPGRVDYSDIQLLLHPPGPKADR